MLSADNRIVQVLAVALLAFFWGVNWPVMKIGLETVEPWTFRALLVTSGALGCFILLGLRRETLALPRADWPMILLLGLFQGILWNGFSGFGIALIEAGRASILAFTMPIWATAFSILFLKETVTRRRLAGLAFGMAGMVCLILPALGAITAELGGTILMVAAAISWAAGTTVFKAGAWRGSLLSVTAWQFVIGAIPLWSCAVLFGRPESLLEVNARTGLALLFSATIPMIFCQLVWFSVVRRVPASLASMGTLTVPVIGVMSAALMLGERVGLAEWSALVLVTVAMVLILTGFGGRVAQPVVSSRASRHPPPASRPG